MPKDFSLPNLISHPPSGFTTNFQQIPQSHSLPPPSTHSSYPFQDIQKTTNNNVGASTNYSKQNPPGILSRKLFPSSNSAFTLVNESAENPYQASYSVRSDMAGGINSTHQSSTSSYSHNPFHQNTSGTLNSTTSSSDYPQPDNLGSSSVSTSQSPLNFQQVIREPQNPVQPPQKDSSVKRSPMKFHFEIFSVNSSNSAMTPVSDEALTPAQLEVKRALENMLKDKGHLNKEDTLSIPKERSWLLEAIVQFKQTQSMKTVAEKVGKRSIDMYPYVTTNGQLTDRGIKYMMDGHGLANNRNGTVKLLKKEEFANVMELVRKGDSVTNAANKVRRPAGSLGKYFKGTGQNKKLSPGGVGLARKLGIDLKAFPELLPPSSELPGGNTDGSGDL